MKEIAYVYATDYTGSESGLGLRPVDFDWCPRGLDTKTLRIEFWGDEGSEFARGSGIGAGQVWNIQNVRLKLGSGDGYAEALFQETRKARRLREEDLDENEHHRDLLS